MNIKKLLKGSLLLIGGVAQLAIAATTAPAEQTIAGQKIGFMSSNPLTFQQLLDEKSAPQPVWGYLNMPKITAKQKVPAVIMLPGAGGLHPWMEKYVKNLNAKGIATFQLDSFSPRGLGGVATDQARLPVPMLVADAFSALQYLAKEPNIDAQRIAVAGWSLGGLVSLTTAFKDLNEGVTNNKVHFAAHVAFYPPCNLIYPNDRLDGAPWLYLHGGADDYTQPSDCLNLIDKERNATVIKAVIYPGAKHGFDNPRPIEWLPNVQNPKNCYGVIANDWSVTEKTTGARIETQVDYQKAYSGCMLRGAHVGFDKKASDAAMQEVTHFLQSNLINNSSNN